MAALNQKDAGLSEESRIIVLLETLIQLLTTTNCVNGSPLLTAAAIQTAHNNADAKAVLASHGSRISARQNS